MDKTILGILADFLINLAAGWTGAAVILPIRVERKKVKRILLTTNIFCAIFSLVAAYFIRRSV